jgi:ABC-type uncharacterized transport system substrate-binding protein
LGNKNRLCHFLQSAWPAPADIAMLGGAAAMPFAARAQQTTRRSIGWFSLRSADTDSEKSILAAFRQGLSQTGYVEGRNLTIEFGFADGQYDRLPALAADLVRRQVEVLVTTGGTPIARVAQAATTTIPIIFATANDPVQDGLVKSINRPGGNSTGTLSRSPRRRSRRRHRHRRRRRCWWRRHCRRCRR